MKDFNIQKMLMAAVAAAALTGFGYEFKTEKDIPYYSEERMSQEGDYARSRCLVDVKYPLGVTNFATVINFHGGGLVRGSKDGPAWPEEARNADPVAFVSAGYRLLTNATPEQCVGDAAAAVAWVVKNIGRYGGDPKKVFVTGVSGGGYLTAMVGMDPKWLAAHGLKLTDLCGIAPFTGQMTKHFNMRKVGFKDDDPQYLPKIDEWAPLAYASTNAVPPSCFLTGGRDTEWKARVEENALLAASLRANGIANCEFHETEGNHGGGVYPSRYFLRDFVMKTCDAGGVARFADGERVAFFGDSITHGGAYHIYLQLFWSTRYPGSGVRLLNCGISGGTAASGLARFDADLLELKPNRVFVMFGMNDVGLGNYAKEPPDEKLKAARAASISTYEANQRKIVERLAEKGIKTVLITPSPYDQYCEGLKKDWVTGNEPGLVTCAEVVRALAAERNLGVVELHRPMTEIFKQNVTRPICRDRVHPKDGGHMLMAALILDGMYVNPFVARAAVDAKTGKAFLPSARNHTDAEGKRRPDCFNARVTHVVKRADGVAFTYAPKALPFPEIPVYTNAVTLYPITERLNREILIVENLAPGKYALAFDGKTVGEFTAEEFYAGVNVALLDTPNQRLARAAAEVADKLRGKTASWRNIVNMEKCILPKNGIDPADRAATDAFLEKWVGKMEAEKKPWAKYYRGCEKAYRNLRDSKPKLFAEIDDLYERLNAVRPSVSRVTVKRK